MERSREKLDFDRWLELARTDQSAFEALRRSMIEEVIESVSGPQQERLRRLQWRIDQERYRASSPMGACVRISRMMWERVMGEGGLLDHLHNLKNLRTPVRPGTQGGEVVSLFSRRDPG